MSKCVVKIVINGKEMISKECDNYVVANQYKIFKEETDHRENVEYVIRKK